MRSRYILPACAFAVLSAAFLLNRQSPKNAPKVQEKRTVESMLNVHGSTRRDLTLCGHKYSDISHYGLGYASVPKTTYVMFVYHRSSENPILVVAETNHCDEIEIPLTGVRFRGDFHRENRGQRIGDFVEGVESNRIVVVSKAYSYVERSAVDLKTASIHVLSLEDTNLTLDFDPRFPTPK